MGACYLATTLVALVFSAVLILFSDPLLALYGIKDVEPGSLVAIARETAQKRLLFMIAPYFLLACMEVGSGVLRGLGRSVTSTLISLVGACLLRIVWILTVFEHYQTLESIYVSYPVSWILTATVNLTLSLLVLRRLKKEQAGRVRLAQ
jgi:Na+-driven multidrug efflux pump